ncbi:ATP/GTP-binding protein [Actinoallomurus rhizosphaericola]|uniref:ATP/GTP-binding protein n=1 Tax=Actinoallomurus rhizosphaericola TaxID=2952536 RepID=UPI0020902208|nr:ATP/GTP-binding protein [Actinoallomurus rhizosphaericola]MCO5993983.1 ATP/GTP-binding protein [Actinoallomurus rhizosphaericola]
MSPRRNRRDRDTVRETGAGAFGGPQRIEEGPDGDWIVRPVAGGTKAYRCPGCDQEIMPGVGHLVAWPAEGGGLDDRRHWHRPCWNHRLNRLPNIQRSRRGPRY